ncbi:branched-chain amino acid transport system II carrier protein [Oceanobacillus sojae]|uniref:branched-chain amino acid transport system II carrier protein n=1 Tax=Oceanobacillus sojae TaxID=582851 RepID=UPI0020C9A3DB|nr:branched-chain amino acid transport system II carrier protein [Oceanobacillus sojae]
MKQTLSNKEILFIGLMVFSLFFGAGNLIFPPELGKNAGESIWHGMGSFLISGIGLPILGLLSIAYASNTGSAEDLSKKIHPVFAVLLTSITYLSIGPFFAGPRTGVVSYEIAIAPFLPNDGNSFSLFIFTIFYFLIVYFLALHPSKFVDRFGKFVTPFLLLILSVLIIAAIVKPFNAPETPLNEYAEHPFFKGITEGYLTMDTIVSIIFATIIINAIRDRGVFQKKEYSTYHMEI